MNLLSLLFGQIINLLVSHGILSELATHLKGSLSNPSALEFDEQIHLEDLMIIHIAIVVKVEIILEDLFQLTLVESKRQIDYDVLELDPGQDTKL